MDVAERDCLPVERAVGSTHGGESGFPERRTCIVKIKHRNRNGALGVNSRTALIEQNQCVQRVDGRTACDIDEHQWLPAIGLQCRQ
jgi:hypothetical protein